MGFTGNRGPLIITAIIIAIIVAGIAVASSGGAPKTNTIGKVVITLRGSIGIENITYANLDLEDSGTTRDRYNLPYSYNISKGNTIQLYAGVGDGYIFNSWDFSGVNPDLSGTSRLSNPLTLSKINSDTIITATVLKVNTVIKIGE
jgi:hypothetical protein